MGEDGPQQEKGEFPTVEEGGVIAPGVTTPAIITPGITTPGVTAPGVTAPGNYMSIPGLQLQY